MFWMKCGKVIRRNSELIKADECPCGYWGIFVLEYYSKRHAEGENVSFTVDDLCNKNLSTFAYNVTYNTIEITNFIYASQKICIPISRITDAAGKVGEQDIDMEDPHSCAEYNEDHSVCLKKYFIKYKIKIYRIGTFYEDYAEFCQFFWSPCGVTPDEDNNYPDPITNGYSCINDHWQPEAEKLYRPSCIVHYDVKEFAFNMWHPAYEHPEDDYSRILSVGIEITNNHDDSGGYYVIGGHESEPYVFVAPDCCTYWNNAEAALMQVNTYEDRREDKVNYTGTNEDLSKTVNIPGNGKNMCFDAWHEAYHGSHLIYNQYWKVFQFAELRIERGTNTPTNAIGVKAVVHAYSYKTNEEYAIVKDATEMLYEDEEVIFPFDAKTELPVCNNMRNYELHREEENCSADCTDGNPPDFYPQGWHNTTEQFTIKLAIIGYIY